jgi:hypothetical protein
VSAVALLLGLLVVAYVGSQLMGGRSGGYRLASGVEYLLLGAALGPYALRAAERATLHAFQPLAVVGTAWITLVIGVEYGYQDGRRVGARGLVTGLLLALASALAAAAAAYAVLARIGPFAGEERRLVAAGVGLVAAETARLAVRWVVGKHGAAGNLSRLVEDIADADDLVPILGMALLFPLIEAPSAAFSAPWWGWALFTPVIGVVLGGTAAALLRAEPRASDGWGVLIGAVLLTTGIAWRFGLAPQAATFALGVSLSAVSRHGAELRAMLARSEQAVLLPTLLLAGADVEVHALLPLTLVLAAAFLARLVPRVLAASVLAAATEAPPGVSSQLALGLLPSGALSVTVGLAFASRFEGAAGESVLAVAVGLAILGELVGPAGLRRALTRAGEITEPAPAEVPPEAGAPPAEEPSP